MKTQNNFQNDSSMQSPKENYHKVGYDSYYINSPSIMTNDQTLIKGKPYLLISEFTKKGMYYMVVKMIHCHCNNELLSIIFEDVHKETTFKVQIDVNKPDSHCPWLLLDISNLQSMVEKIETYDYCLG